MSGQISLVEDALLSATMAAQMIPRSGFKKNLVNLTALFFKMDKKIPLGKMNLYAMIMASVMKRKLNREWVTIKDPGASRPPSQP